MCLWLLVSGSRLEWVFACPELIVDAPQHELLYDIFIRWLRCQLFVKIICTAASPPVGVQLNVILPLFWFVVFFVKFLILRHKFSVFWLKLRLSKLHICLGCVQYQSFGLSERTLMFGSGGRILFRRQPRSYCML